VVVGLGPGGPDLVSDAARTALDPSLGTVLLRTSRHPAASVAGPAARSFDYLYETHPDRRSLYLAITDALLEEAETLARERPGARVAYAVPGSPLVAERSVELLRRLAPERGVAVEVLPALSFLDLCWERLGLDPVEAGVRLVDGEAFGVRAAGDEGPFLVSHCWNAAILSSVKLALEEPREDASAVILHHLGLPDEVVAEVAWPELDRTIEPDHLTTVFVPRLSVPVAGELAALGETAAMLRLRCPWDREQTHHSLVRHLLEESYEAVEAIENLPAQPAEASAEQAAHLEEELGDLLFQVYFHSLLAAEEGLFNLADVARTLNDKLVARHPHVFGDAVAESAEAVLGQWERRKQLEKGRDHLFDGVPRAMPALARAAKFERKLASVGLGAESAERAEPAGRPEPADGPEPAEPVEPGVRPAPLGEEAAGDRLLRLARDLAAGGVDPEAALRLALDRLADRVGELEARAAAEGRSLAETPPDVLRDWMGA
jgi:tetrapyrrole methylase family protein/MazG family protein